MIGVFLSQKDMRWAADIGNERYEHSKRMGLKARFEPGKSPQAHISGAIGELAFCRALDLPWQAYVDTFKSKPDVDPFWEVHWSRNPKRVPVKVNDPRHGLVAHVTGQPPNLTVV